MSDAGTANARDLEAELDALYRGPAKAFVAGRNELVQALKRTGDRDRAEAVARLERPSPAAWVVNQLHYENRELLDALIESGAALRDAQETAVEPEEFSARQRAHQRALRAAADRGLALAEASGTTATAALRRKVESTLNLLSAATAGVVPSPGRMSAELEPLGFDAITDVVAAPPRKESRRGPSADAEEAGRAEKMAAVRAALDAAEKEVRRLAREAEASETTWARIAREVDEIERRLEGTRRERDEARRAADEAAARLAKARNDLESARREIEPR